MPVTHCMCYDISIEELKARAKSAGITGFEELRDHTKCGTGCGMCEPYVRLMLRTGQTRFRVLNELTLRQMAIDRSRGVEPSASQPSAGPVKQSS